jgi:hypothetical protein
MEKIARHLHNGTDAPKLVFSEAIENAPQTALTTGTSSTAGALYTNTERDMINNLKTRVAELETRLQTLGILK